MGEVTGGDLPQGRPTLVAGSAGCGKTLLGVEFLAHGALDHGELARGDEIVAVPTLVRSLPEPIRRINGDLSDTEKVLVGLRIRPAGGLP